MIDQESIDSLKKIVAKGQDFGCSVIQRHLKIGYCAAWRLMTYAVHTDQAYWETETRIKFK